MLERRWVDTSLKFVPLVVGLLLAVYSSLPVLDPRSSLWANDEGLFLNQGQAGGMNLDLRYGVFSVLIFIYFKIFQIPFAVAVAHKVVMLCVFVALFQRRVLEQAGGAVFVFLFVVFLYLNSYMLRDSLIFVACLLAVTTLSTDRSVGGALRILPIALLRPQSLVFFVRPWISAIATVVFIVYLRPRYATAQLRDNGDWTIFHIPFWEDVSKVIITSLTNLNPLPKFPFYVQTGQYLDYALLVLASLPLFAVLAQSVLAVVSAKFRFWHYHHVIVGMTCLLLMYGAIGVPADVRVFFATVCPFFFFAHKALLKPRYVVILGLALVLATVVRAHLKTTGL